MRLNETFHGDAVMEIYTQTRSRTDQIIIKKKKEEKKKIGFK